MRKRMYETERGTDREKRKEIERVESEKHQRDKQGEKQKDRDIDKNVKDLSGVRLPWCSRLKLKFQ